MQFYAIPSGVVFGGFMYYMGKLGLIDNTHKKQHKHQQQKQPSAIPTSATPQKQLSSGIANNTFSQSAITSIIRTIQINPKCKFHKTPLSVHQLLDLKTIEGTAERAKNFFKDPSIKPQKFAASNDNYYKNGAFKNFSMTRGHMAAASNYSGDQDEKNSTFSFANIVPQHGYNNGGIWNTFQRYCRRLLQQKKCDTLEIISGPIYSSDKKLEGYENIYVNENIVLSKNGVIIPPKLYKIIKCNTRDKAYASGFTFLNSKTEDNQKNLSDFEEQIESIQDQTGLTFNLKQNLSGKLSQYDIQGLNRSKLKYDIQFYQKLFQSAQTTQQMNSVLRRAYEQKVSLDEQRERNAKRIQIQSSLQIQTLLNRKDVTHCQRLSQLLNLHKSLFYLGGDQGKYSVLMRQLEQNVMLGIPLCRDTVTRDQYRNISYKAGYQSKKYRYPHAQLLKQVFPKQRFQQPQKSTTNP